MDHQTDLTGRPARFDGAFRARKSTWPVVPGDWTTSKTVRPIAANDNEPAPVPAYWLGGRPCRFPATYTGKRVWTLPMGAANDNAAPARRVVTMENDSPPPGWLARRDAAGDATEYGQMGTRIERALVADVRGEPGKPETANDAAVSVVMLRRLREIMRPAELKADNDNALMDDGETEDSRSHGLERIHNQSSILPSIPKLRSAYADGMRCRVTTARNGTVTRVSRQAWTTKRGESTVWIGGMDGRRFVGLLFLRGRLEFYGDRGQKCRVDYRTKVAAAKPKRKNVAEARLDEMCGTTGYLRLRGTAMPPATTHPDAPRALPGVIPPKKAADRLWLAHICEGHPVTRCPPGLAAMWRKDSLGLECGYGRLGGVSEAKGVGEGKTAAPRHSSLDEIDRAIGATGVTATLSERESAVLAAIIEGDSFQGVAKSAGKNPTAHNGRRIAIKVLSDFQEKLAA